MQQHQMFERNMAYQSPVNSSLQTPIDHQTVWGEGVGPEVQFPPTDLTNLGRNAELLQGSMDQRQIQMAGLIPNGGYPNPSQIEAIHGPDVARIPSIPAPSYNGDGKTLKRCNNTRYSMPSKTPSTQTAKLSTACLKLLSITNPGVKRYPEGDRTQSSIPKWLRYFASGGETLDPQERIDQNTQVLVAHVKSAAKTFGEIADELRLFGSINAAFKDGHVTL
ncbi:MAG: hypothetical protein KFB95_06925 [Simkaniaceae bacterium]|nr:MAG: hypothetical protein KFB95_06925 [Simkaniaceae bacterium]